MNYSFYIQKGSDPAIQVDEPVGWDGFALKIKRHPTRHGTMREIQNTNFEFDAEAAMMINDEYNQYGLRAKLSFIIDWGCGDDMINLYNGNFMFKTWSETCGGCGCKISIDQTGALVDFIYRLNQKVDLDNPKCFDNVTDLAAYSALKPSVLLHSKAIVIQAKASLKNNVSYDIDADSGWGLGSSFSTGQVLGSINPVFDTIEFSEIEDFTPEEQVDFLNYSAIGEKAPEIINIKALGALKCIQDYEVSFKLKGRFILTAPFLASGGISVTLNLKKGNVGSTGFNDATNTNIYSTYIQSGSVPRTDAFDITHTETISLVEGEKLWLTFFINYVKTTNYTMTYKMELDAGNYFDCKALSFCEDTNADGFLVHEALSRITESITNNGLKAYSSFYGRTDSQPFAFDVDGCGGLRTIHNGLQIRRNKLADGTDPKMFVSMEDMLNGLQPIDNVGVGIETISGQEVIRIENWKYFYKNTVTLSCTGISKPERLVQENEHYSTVKIGYDKWEAEEFNGLDEMLTKREYRIEINGVQNTFEKISKMIASGYAIEVTRRKGLESKDWRYDNNIFIICLVRGDDGFESENNNIADAENIIDPPTVYNFRITPARMTMRWYDRIMACIRNLGDDDRIIFNSGDGNHLAKGKLTTGCIQEAAVLSESEDITRSDFENEEDAAPINFSERIKYSYPVTNAEWKALDLNGLVYWEGDGCAGYGWIDEFVFKPDRESDFLLIPKR